MFELYLERAQLVDGQDILELGCGWGSLSIFVAEKLPNSRVTGVSNSHSQREYILALAIIFTTTIIFTACKIDSFITGADAQLNISADSLK